MCISTNQIIGFTIPIFHPGKRSYVAFSALDPAEGVMKRVRYYVSNKLSTKEQIKRAQLLIKELLAKLNAGWNPFANPETNRGYLLIKDVLENYVKYIEKSLRKKSYENYKSRVKVMQEYINSTSIPIRCVYQIDEAFMNDFLDWLVLDREVSPRTRNNYRLWLSSFADYLVKRKYIASNPVPNIENMKEGKKRRQPLTKEMLERLKAEAKEKDPHFYLACLMMYYTFIRPTEMSYIKIGDISIKEQTILVRAENAKNKKDGYVALHDSLIKEMVAVGTFNYPSHYYLFGKKFKPAESRAGADQFNKTFAKYRKLFRWKSEYMFYSLKDSGIRDLANASGIVIARDQARHSDISVTNRYLQGKEKVHEEAKHFKGEL